MAGLVAAVEDSARDAENSTTPDSTDFVAKDMAAPDTTRGPEGTCSPESTDWGADDEVPEEWRLKNTPGRAERTHKSQKLPPDQHQGTCPAEKFDHHGTMNPSGPQWPGLGTPLKEEPTYTSPDTVYGRIFIDVTTGIKPNSVGFRN